MRGELNLFESVKHLEPKCPNCESKIDYDVTTRYVVKYHAHVCRKCGHVLK